MGELSGRECPGDGPGVILVAIDGSTTSVRAAAWAAGLARRQGSGLVFLFVATHPALAELCVGMGGVAPPSDYGNDDVARELLRELRDAATAYRVSARFLVRSGEPAAEIARLADELRVDAVVVGASMQFGHRLAGSVAVRLVRAGKWPVTVVP